MIARLLFRTLLSLGLLLGIASYGHHLAGGDPGALWGRVADGALGRTADSFAAMRGTVSAPATALSGAVGGERRESVWTWQDANGVTHYATGRPADVEAAMVTVDPDRNVLAPVAAPPPRRRSDRERGADETPADGRLTAGGDASAAAMPGLAGAALRAHGDAPAADPARTEALLRLLQPGAR